MGQPAESLRVEAVTPAGAVSIVDLRPPRDIDYGPLRHLEARSGAAVGVVLEQARQFRLTFDAELQHLAGTTELPASVQARAHLAVDTMVQQRLLSLAAAGSAGRWARAAAKLEETALDADIAVVEGRERTLTHVAKHAAGLAVMCRDLLESARAAARAVQAEQAGGVVPGLMGRLGIAPARTGSTETHPALIASSDPSPALAPGGGVDRGPLPSNPGTQNSPPAEEGK